MPKHLLLILAILGLAFCPGASQAQDSSTAGKLSLFPILPRGAPPDAMPHVIPIANNLPLGGTHPGMTRAIIGIHDASRNAQGMMTLFSTIAGPANEKTFILAPQYLIENDIMVLYPDLPEVLRKKLAFWPMDAWQDGGDSTVERPERPISSFTALDLILMYLSQKEAFPDLKDIIIAGHGDGADFVQRYAAAGTAPAIVEKQGISVRFVVANASSYLYLTQARPKQDAVGFYSPAATVCWVFNYYKYGLEYPPTYIRQVGENAIKTNYGDRTVAYLLGQDIGRIDPAPDNNCAAMFEGPNRYLRGMNYNLYVHQLYGDAADRKQKTYVIPKTGYDPVAMFASSCGLSLLFGDGTCPNPVSTTVEIR